MPDDANSPRIAADKEKINYPIQEEAGTGFTVTEQVPPFTAVSLAIKTDEPAQCKFSLNPGTPFQEQEFSIGSQFLDFKHQIDFSLPSELANEQSLQLTNGGKYTIYVRCEDANGNKNERDYTINFQIKPGPDLEPPKIQSTSILSGTNIQSEIETVSVDLFANEPSSCKWSSRDLEYNLMENNLICASSGLNLGTTGSYKCSTSLPVEKAESSAVTNTFYFRCKDNANNANRQGYRYNLISTPQLQITKTSPEGILRSGAGITLEVTTANGAESGKAVCGYSLQDQPITNIPKFQTTDSSTHTQTLQLLEQGPKKFFITCIDKAGNEAKSSIEFTIEADTSPPVLLSVFKDTQLNILKIITNEPTTCEYSDQQFSYGSGIPMTNPSSISHESNLGNAIYIIKCQDEFANEASFNIFP